MHSFRTRGLRPITYNDIVVFNRANHRGWIKFVINFKASDNVLNSQDSRYLGVVPEEYIVGIVSKVERNGNRASWR